MSTVSLRSGYGVSCDPYDPSWSPLSLLLPHYSEVTQTLQFPVFGFKTTSIMWTQRLAAGGWEVAPPTQYRRCVIPTYNVNMEGKTWETLSWVAGGSEILAFVRLSTRECVQEESWWRSLYTEHRASRSRRLLFTLGPLNSPAKDLLREGAAAAEYSWAQTVGTLSVHFSYQTGSVW